MSSGGYTIDDVQAAKRRVRKACPDVILSDDGDYGFKLVGYKRYADGMPYDALILFQPARKNGQREIISNIDEAIRHWGGTP